MQLTMSYDSGMATAPRTPGRQPRRRESRAVTPPDTMTGGAAERAFLDTYDPAAFPPVAVTVDVVLLTVRAGRLHVLLVRRAGHPHRGEWALPCGFVLPGEDLDHAAARELVEESGLPAGVAHLEQVRSYGRPDRDPRMRVISIAYLALAPDLPRPTAGGDAADARFFDVEDVTADRGPALAFDHNRILLDAVERARAKLEYNSLATNFLEEPFTIADLRRVYEAVWGHPLHPANFRRKVLAAPAFLTPTGEERATGRGWADLYHAGATTTLHPAILRPHTDQPRSPAVADRQPRDSPASSPAGPSRTDKSGAARHGDGRRALG
jgi:8-oxo-dGTP diphosphatase